MKKLLIILLVMGCGKLFIVPQVTVFFETDFIISSVTNLGGRMAIDIPGFDMKYDTVNLLVNGGGYGTNNNYYEKQVIGDIVRQITINPGTYDFYMSSEKSKMTIDALDSGLIYNDHLVFSAILDSTVVDVDMSVILPTEHSQAILLLYKTGIIDPPLVSHTTTNNGSDYGTALMVEDDIYYYIYLYGSWNYIIDYTFNGAAGQLIRTFEAGKVYRYSFNQIGIGITDPFDEIIDNY